MGGSGDGVGGIGGDGMVQLSRGSVKGMLFAHVQTELIGNHLGTADEDFNVHFHNYAYLPCHPNQRFHVHFRLCEKKPNNARNRTTEVASAAHTNSQHATWYISSTYKQNPTP
jgi:hypothetical protein